MSAIPISRILSIGFMAHLLLFSFISVSVCEEFKEDTGKLNLLRRGGHQWAIGHFMGKKSLQDTYRLREQDMEDDFPPRSMESRRANLLQEQRRALPPRPEMLSKFMDKYIKMYQK